MGKSLYYIQYNGNNNDIMYNYHNYISIDKIDAPIQLFIHQNDQLNNQQSPSHIPRYFKNTKHGLNGQHNTHRDKLLHEKHFTYTIEQCLVGIWWRDGSLYQLETHFHIFGVKMLIRGAYLPSTIS